MDFFNSLIDYGFRLLSFTTTPGELELQSVKRQKISRVMSLLLFFNSSSLFMLCVIADFILCPAPLPINIGGGSCSLIHSHIQIECSGSARKQRIVLYYSRFKIIYYLIREIKTWLNINYITVHNNTYCIF